MSHFTEMKVNFKTTHEKEFVAALESSFGKGNIEVYENGTSLIGYQGDSRANLPKSSPDYAPLCHIVIRRKVVGPSSNDVGYRRTEDGSYAAYISEFDQGRNFQKKKQDAVAQDYTTRVAEKSLKTKGYTLKRTVLKDGTVKLVATKYG
jgi:hypothetical protein